PGCSLAGQADFNPQAAFRRLSEGDLPAVAMHDIAGNGEAKSAAAGIHIARWLQAEEGAEHVASLGFGDPRSVIINQDYDLGVCLPDAHPDFVGVARGVADEIGDAALEAVRPDFGGETLRASCEGDRGTLSARIGDHILHEFGNLVCRLLLENKKQISYHPLHGKY